MTRFAALLGPFVVLMPAFSLAGQIGIGDFTAAATVQGFEVLGTASINYTSPLLIGVDSFDGDDHLLRSSSKFGITIGTSGTALSNSPGKSSASVGFIDILLGNPALRGGLYVGFQFPWAANVEFYDVDENLLGTIALSGSGKDNGFAAWQADGGLIERVRVTDSINNGHPIIIDDFIQEIPEPLILVLVDIKPGGSANLVNPKSKGAFSVAILSTDDFDVHDVDIDTLLFGDPLLLDNGGTAVSPLRSAWEDVSGDGLLDLTLKFSTRDLVELGALGSDTIEGLLTGELLDGTPFAGMDSIRIVPPTNTGRSPLVVASVPEPSSFGLVGLGLMLPLVLTRRIHSLRAGPFSSH